MSRKSLLVIAVLVGCIGLSSGCQNSDMPSDIKNQVGTRSAEKTATSARARLSDSTAAVETGENAESSATDDAANNAPAEIVAPAESETPAQAKVVTEEDVQQSAQAAIASAEAFAKEKQKAYHAAIDQRVAAFVTQLDTIRERAEFAGEQAKQNVTAEIEKVTSKIVEAQRQLAEVKQANETRIAELQSQLDQLLATVEVPSVETLVEKVPATESGQSS